MLIGFNHLSPHKLRINDSRVSTRKNHSNPFKIAFLSKWSLMDSGSSFPGPLNCVRAVLKFFVNLNYVIICYWNIFLTGLVGLAISYALSITGLLSGVVNSFTETEKEMIAVERVNQYIEEVESENSNVVLDPPYGWPSQGVVSFNHVVMKYR